MLDLHRLCQDISHPKTALRKEADSLVREIYGFLRRPSPQTEAALNAWRGDFRIIYGEASLSAHKRLDPDVLLRDAGVPPEGDREEQMLRLLLSAQTYFSLVLKTAMAAALDVRPPNHASVILGTFAEARGVVNYCQRDWSCWPLAELEHGFDRVMEAVSAQVIRYASPSGGPARSSRDDVKRLYEALIPRRLRHALGEYYTPDWLASYTLDRGLAFRGEDVRTLSIADPACGSGTFLVQAIARKREAGASLEEILDAVWGFDINPLAVLAAKSNYLLSLLDLLDGRTVEAPVFRRDALALGLDEKRAGLVAGNPPWINWEYLPAACRERSGGLWDYYGLLEGRGISRSFLKTDVSDLMTYTAADRLLAPGGTLALIVRQGVFKSGRNGEGFRRFRLPDGGGLQVLRVDDLSRLKIFEGAAGGAAALFARKGGETEYPIPYGLWTKAPGMKRGPVDPRLPPEGIGQAFQIQEQYAVPAASPGAPWLTAPAEELEGLQRMLGSNPYRGRSGVFTGGANGVYWLRILSGGEGAVVVENIQDRAKRKAGHAEAELEAAYVYPMLKGGGVCRWRTSYDAYLLCPHTQETKLRPVPWEQLADECPRTAAYLAGFRDILDQRKGFAGWEKSIQREEFHAVLRVGRYTFQRWKVVWRYIASSFVCAVAGEVEDPYLGRKLLLPNEKVMYVATDSEEEAYYLCGVLSSTPAARCVKGYMNPTSISAHVLGKLRIPKYDGGDPVHREIARLCREGHFTEDIEPVLAEIDRLAIRLSAR